jgi:hypothetical protein
MAESLDKLPLGIYKSIMAKAYRLLNHPVLYDDYFSYTSLVLKPTEMFSPIHNNEYSLEIEKKKLATRKYNKERNLKSKQTFLEDYLKSLND